MPKNLDSKELATHEAVRAIGHDMYMDKMDPDAAMEMIGLLAMELNSKFMTDLGFAAGDEAECGSVVSDKYPNIRLIFVGGSHVARLAEAAESMGIDHVNLSMPGFSIREDTIDTAVVMLKETVAESVTRDIIVYQLFDNNVFFEAHEDGSRSLPSKDTDDNMYHIDGRLVFADHGVIRNLVNNATPLLRAGGENAALHEALLQEEGPPGEQKGRGLCQLNGGSPI
jgi:hypothetical protein